MSERDVMALSDVMVLCARGIARRAHRGQFDKAGRPYIDHPERVASSVEGPLAKTVAWLHDVVEDSRWTLDDLRSFGMPEEVVAAVDAITHRNGEPRSDYYARVRSNPVARLVKLADIADNADAARLAVLDPETAERLRAKYAAAREQVRQTKEVSSDG